jgi:hypothetical protein
MKKQGKSRITITLDWDVAQIFARLSDDRCVKTSSYINKILRRHFLRPGKGMEDYALTSVKARGTGF